MFLQYNILITDDLFIKNIFEDNKIKTVFSVNFVNNKNIIKELNKNTQDFDLIIIDKSIDKNILDTFTDIETPKILIADNLSDEEQNFFYSQNIDDIIIAPKDLNLLALKLKNIVKKYKEYKNNINKLQAKINYSKKIQNDTDPKTGLLKEDAFKIYTASLLKDSTEDYVMLQFDIDGFKIFNELFGFGTGDKLLKSIGDKLLQNLQPNETAGRLQADHFILCIKKKNLQEEMIAKYIVKYLSSIFPDFYFLVKVGLYEIKDKSEDISLMITRSLLALISVKQDFTTSYAYYEDTMTSELKNEQELISDMVIGLQKEEFEVYLQPQYDYTSESLIGAEALVRWNHGKKGMISPIKFIPVFERNGFITQLDEYVWDKTCKLVRSWLDKGLNPVPVSVNISRRDIYNTNLLEHFDTLLKKYKLSPKLIRLEITESAYMENPVQLIKVVEGLREKGFCVEMDDFGSGYSSLNTLKEVPVDVLKLDMKFIMDQTDKTANKEKRSKSGSILSSVVRMANWLNLPVIAEGIESREQADYLKSIGCFQMQGFYFARPMPAKQYEELLLDLPILQDTTNKDNPVQAAANFLDASTQSTLLFNSFVGGAAIIEWTGSTVEAIRMNDLFFEEIGVSRSDYLSAKKNTLERIAKDSKSVFLTNLAEATRTGFQTFCEIQCIPIYKNTNPYWLRVRVRHLAKTITSDIFYISIENINFRMHLLELNTSLSEQLANIMESSPCGIINLSYSDELEIQYLNETFAKMFGYNQSEFRVMMHQDVFSIFSEKDKKDKKEYLYKIIKEKKPSFTASTRALCKNGILKRVQISGNLFEKSNGSLNLNIVVVDIEQN